jgi:hypothetical protein
LRDSYIRQHIRSSSQSEPLHLQWKDKTRSDSSLLGNLQPVADSCWRCYQLLLEPSTRRVVSFLPLDLYYLADIRRRVELRKAASLLPADRLARQPLRCNGLHRHQQVPQEEPSCSRRQPEPILESLVLLP